MIPAKNLIDKLNTQSLSDRLRLAVDAMRFLETKAFWQIDMTRFHGYDTDTGICTACAGGAAAIAFFGQWDEVTVNRTDLVSEYQLDPLYDELLEALFTYENSIDMLRHGLTTSAYMLINPGKPVPVRITELGRSIHHYSLGEGTGKFYQECEDLIHDLATNNF